jgi:hypothetical protein
MQRLLTLFNGQLANLSFEKLASFHPICRAEQHASEGVFRLSLDQGKRHIRKIA